MAEVSAQLFDLPAHRLHSSKYAVAYSATNAAPLIRNLLDAVNGFLLGKTHLILDRDPVFTDRFRRLLKDAGTRDWAVGKLNACGWLAFTGMGKSTTDAYVWNGSTPVLLPRLTGSSGGRAYHVSDQGDVVGMARFTPKNQDSYGVAALWRGAVAPCAP